jgi:hypothetical protein
MIRELRSRGWNLSAIALKIGYTSPSSLYGLEAGKPGSMSRERFSALEELFASNDLPPARSRRTKGARVDEAPLSTEEAELAHSTILKLTQTGHWSHASLGRALGIKANGGTKRLLEPRANGDTRVTREQYRTLRAIAESEGERQQSDRALPNSSGHSEKSSSSAPPNSADRAPAAHGDGGIGESSRPDIGVGAARSVARTSSSEGRRPPRTDSAMRRMVAIDYFEQMSRSLSDRLKELQEVKRAAEEARQRQQDLLQALDRDIEQFRTGRVETANRLTRAGWDEMLAELQTLRDEIESVADG